MGAAIGVVLSDLGRWLGPTIPIVFRLMLAAFLGLVATFRGTRGPCETGRLVAAGCRHGQPLTIRRESPLPVP